MKITVEDASMVNWERVLDQVTTEAQEKAKEAVGKAQAVLSALTPGKRMTVYVKVGSITVARPK